MRLRTMMAVAVLMAAFVTVVLEYGVNAALMAVVVAVVVE